MNKRMLLLAGLICLLLTGLVAGFFTNSIQSALALPARPSMPARPVNRQPVRNVMLPPAITPTAGLVQQGGQNTLAQDTFQRADQILWGTASDGQRWGGDANVLTNNFSINGNHGQITNGNGTFNALLGLSQTDAEDVLDGSLSHFDGSVNMGVVLRYQDPNNWYKALIDGKQLILLKNVHGTSTRLAWVPFVAQDNQPYSLHFRVVGTMLFARAWPDGTAEPSTWMITASDSTFQSGLAGIRVVLRPDMSVAVMSFTATIPIG